MDCAHRRGQPADERPLACPHVELLRTFCVAVDSGSIGRAAQRLHLTQPAVSRRLKSLEEQIGVPLLQRSSSGVRMTSAGERLYAHARRMIADMHELAAALDRMRDSRSTVHLAISHTAAESLLPRALVLMQSETRSPVEVLIANSRVVKELVLEGQADVGIAACMDRESLSGAISVELIEDEIVIAVPLAHPWARRRSIAPLELLSSPIVLRDPGAHSRQVLEHVLGELRLPAPRAAAEVGSTQAGKEQAHALCLPVVVSRLALSAADRLEALSVDGIHFRRRLCALHQPGVLSHDSGHLIAAFQAAAAELQRAVRHVSRDAQAAEITIAARAA